MSEKSKKGQTGGLITGLIFGIASLVVGVIIAFVVVSTLTGADLMTEVRIDGSVVNETGNLNATGYTLGRLVTNFYVPGAITITAITNASTAGGELIPSSNYSVDSDGSLSNSSGITGGTGGWDLVNITYTYKNYSSEELSSNRMSSNFTAGVGNVSEKIPTVLLVAAIVLILGILAVLVGVWQRMRTGQGI